MGQMRLPGMSPGYVRIELLKTDDGTWSLVATEGEAVQWVRRDDRTTYPGLSWGEALQLAGQVLDSIDPGEPEAG